eukprot:NODE_63_length_26141_cov_1.022656.p9 type:complete len:372 gc:universal NODE_63_length_26141_cov_1.022656:17122-16007(-)
MNLATIIWSAFQPVINLLIMVLLGMYLKWKKLYNEQNMSDLSRIDINYFLPCLMFSKIIVSISTNNITEYGLVLCTAFIFQCYYILCGVLIYLTTRKYQTPYFKKGVINSTAFGNWADSPFAIILAIGNSEPFKDGDANYGLALFTAFFLISSPFIFTLGIHWIKSDYKELNEEPEVETKRMWDNPMVKLILRNPNIIAIVLGVIVAVITPLKNQFTLEGGYLHFLFITISTIGGASIPVGITLFGANLLYADFSALKRIFGFGVDSRLPRKIFVPIFAVVFFRMIFCPFIGVAYSKALVYIGLVSDSNKMMQFVLALPMCLPVAQMNLIFSQIFHPNGNPTEMATLVAICYAVAPFTMIASLTGIIYAIQ